jgi:hypothetical protein
VKAITAANAEAAHSVSRASAQAAHDAAMLDAIEDWQDITSTSFVNSLISSSNAFRDYSINLTDHWADWNEATEGKTGEAPDTPKASVVDSIIGILNPFNTDGIAATTAPNSDANTANGPRRPNPSAINVVYSIYGIVSEHTPEEWEVIREHQNRGWSISRWFVDDEQKRMKDAGFKLSFRHLDEDAPPSSIPSPKLPSAPIAPVQPQPLPEPAPETESTNDYDPLDVWANARIPYITDFLAGIVRSTAGDEFLLTTSSEGLILYTVGSSMIIVGSLYIAPQACASYVTTFMFGAASAVVQYWGINALGNFINSTHNDTTVEGTLQSAILGGVLSIPGKWLRGGCFVEGTLVRVLEEDTFDEVTASCETRFAHNSEYTAKLDRKRSCSDTHFQESRIVARPIEQIRIGHKLPAVNLGEWFDESEVEEIDQDEWVKLTMVAYRSDGAIIDIEIIRPVEFVLMEGITVGSSIPFVIPELKLDGLAKILAISECPDIPTGTGMPVTGRFVTRQVDQIARVELRSQSGRIATLEGTPIHPIWSHDRQDWIPLGELLPGECLDGEDELVYVQALEILERSVSVFNIEVQHEHMYRVGEFGILVHNSDECLPFWRVFENLEFDYLNKLYGTGTFLKNPVNRGIDFVSDRLQLAIDAKAWGNMAWQVRSMYKGGQNRNANMLTRLEMQVENHMRTSTYNLRLDFAWKIPDEVAAFLNVLKVKYPGRFDFQADMLAKFREIL